MRHLFANRRITGLIFSLGLLLILPKVLSAQDGLFDNAAPQNTGGQLPGNPLGNIAGGSASNAASSLSGAVPQIGNLGGQNPLSGLNVQNPLSGSSMGNLGGLDPGQLGNFANGLGTNVGELGNLSSSLGSLGSQLQTAGGEMAGQFSNNISALSQNLGGLQSLGNLGNMAQAAQVGNMIGQLGQMSSQFSSFGQQLSGLGGQFQQLAGQAGNIAGQFNSMASGLQGNMQQLTGQLQGLQQQLGQAMQQASQLQSALQGQLGQLTQALGGMQQTMQSLLNGATGQLANALGNITGQLGNLSGLANSLGGAGLGNLTEAQNVLNGMMQNVQGITGIVSQLGALGNLSQILGSLMGMFSTGGTLPDPLQGKVDNIPDYEAPKREEFLDKEIKDTPKAAKEVADTMAKTLEKLNKAVNSYGGAAAVNVSKIVDGQGDLARKSLTIGGKTFENMPKKYPLDMGESGHLNKMESWREYKKDSKALLNPLTFGDCLETREVHEPQFVSACEMNCPTLVNIIPLSPEDCPCSSLLCKTQKKKVIEYYWPEYIISVNRAGAKMISPVEFGAQSRKDWVRRALKMSNRQQVEQQQRQDLEKKGIKMSEWVDPEWRQGEFEYQEHGDSDYLFGRGYRPNFEWRAADDRPLLYWLGTDLSPKCANWALPERTSQRYVMSNTQEQGMLHYLNTDPTYMELKGLIEPGDYKKVIAASGNRTILGAEEDDAWKTGNFFVPHKAARDRTDLKVFRELKEALGVEPKEGGRRMNEIVLRRLGEAIMPYSATTEFMPVLSFHALRAAATALQYGSQAASLKAYNTSTNRQVHYSLAQNPERWPGYEGKIPRQDEKILYVDKLQRLYPREGENPKSPVPGKAGACFRPENIPNYETDSDDENWPKDLMQYHHLGESRWAVWNKRVMCVCSWCGTQRGCVSLHDGDVKKDKFYGTNEVSQNDPLNAIGKAYPFFVGYAEKQGPPIATPADLGGVRIPGADVGSPGPWKGAWKPKGPASLPSLQVFGPPTPLLCLAGIPGIVAGAIGALTNLLDQEAQNAPQGLDPCPGGT